MPGLGKTQLAIRFGISAKPRYSFIFWVSASSVDKINTGFLQIYTLVTGDGGNLDTLIVKTQKWFESNDKWLLIVDNVNHDTMQYLTDLLPQADGKGNILITTRYADVAEALGHARGEQHPAIDLQVLTLADATDLFLTASTLNQKNNLRGPATEPNSIEALVSTLGYLPLAIDHAAAFAKTSGHTPREILTFHHSEGSAHLYEWEHSLSKHEAHSVVALFEPILQQIHRTAPLAYDILQVLAFLDPESLSIDIIEQGLDRYQYWKTTRSKHILWPKYFYKIKVPYNWGKKLKEMRTLQPVIEAEEDKVKEHILRLQTAFKSRPLLMQNLQVLQQSSLLHTKGTEMRVFWMHDLVQAFLRHRSPSSVQHIALCIVTTACLANKDLSELKSWKWAAIYAAHISALSQQLEWAGTASLRLLLAQGSLAVYLMCSGRYYEAERLNQAILASATNMLGAQHFETLRARYYLAWICFENFRSNEAVMHAEEYMKIMAGPLKGNHPDIFWVRTLLSRAYSQSGRYQDAEKLVKELVREELIQDKSRLKTRYETELPQATAGLASLFYDQGHYDNAELLQRQVCHWCLGLYGYEDLRTIRSMYYLATIIHAQDRKRDAVEVTRQVLSLHTKLTGVDEPYTKQMIRMAETWESEISTSLIEDQFRHQNYLQELSSSDMDPDVVSLLADILQLSETQVRSGLLDIESKCESQERSRRAQDSGNGVASFQPEPYWSTNSAEMEGPDILNGARDTSIIEEQYGTRYALGGYANNKLEMAREVFRTDEEEYRADSTGESVPGPSAARLPN